MDHPMRRRLLDLLRRGGSATVSGLREQTGLSRATVRHHLLRLERDGLVVESLSRSARGRPPVVYSPVVPGGSRSPDLPLSVLAAMLAAARRRSPQRIGAMVAVASDYLASGWREIEAIADPEPRLRAALAVLSDPATTEVQRVDGGFAVAVYSCPLLPAALQSPELCHLCPAVLRRLAGVQLERQQCIAHGDTRCAYLATVIHSASGGHGSRVRQSIKRRGGRKA